MSAQAHPPAADHAFLHGLLFFALAWAAGSTPAFGVWPLPLAVPLISYLVLLALIPSLRLTAPRMEAGRASALALKAAVAIAIVSTSALIAFDRIMRPDVSEYRAFLPVSALGGTVCAGVLFSLLNPVLEEVIFRGILFGAVRSQVGSIATVLITAALFGIAHMRGYPPGATGATLAFLYGIAMGGLRLLAGGIALPILAHVAADATIYVLIERAGVFSR
jgi:uncharacterized protein